MDEQRVGNAGEVVHIIPITLESGECIVGNQGDQQSPSPESTTTSETESGNTSVSPSSDKHLIDQTSAVNPSLVNKRNSVTPTRLPHKLKTIVWHNKKIPIVTQNENGPCPLISIVNVLLLRSKIILPASTQSISANQLIEHIAESILDNIPKDLSEVRMLNYEQNMHDAIAVLPRLMTGLDVNIKFTGVQDFEYTPECIIFDLLNIPLYHGWLVDPQDGEAVTAIGGVGYNQLVDKIITNKSSDKVEEVTHALVAEQFLERTASQMTYHGLCVLNSAMQENELAVLFRNNHFSTILKKGIVVNPKPKSQMTKVTQTQNELFQLVTDQGFLHESCVVWETINNIDGAGDFVDSLFKTAPPKSSNSFVPGLTEVSQEQQIDQDFLVALSLQEDQKTQSETEQAWEEFKLSLGHPEGTISDAQLARHLQQREDEQQGKTTTPIAPPPDKEVEPQPPQEPAEPAPAAPPAAPAPRPHTPPDRKRPSCQLQ